MSYNNGPRIVTNGLVLCLDAANTKSYPGTGTVWTDLSGNGNNGTLTNGPSYSSINKGSIIFDGTNDYIACGSNSSLNLSNNYTISLWIRTTSSVSGSLVQRYLNSGSFPGYQIAINRTTAGKLDLYTAGSWYLNNGNNLNNGNWQNIVFAIDSTTASLYQNLSLSNFSVAASTSNPSTIFYIGIVQGVSSPFNGNISQMQIYNRALSTTEVAQNYNATKGRFGL